MNGYVTAINDVGQAVGESDLERSTNAVVWMDGQVHDLNDLIPSGTEYRLIRAEDINNAGQIVCVAEGSDGKRELLLLTPETGGRRVWKKGLSMVSMPSIPWESDPKKSIGFTSNYWYSYSPETNSYVGYANQSSWLAPAESTPVRGFWARFDADTPVPFWTIPQQGEPVSIPLKHGWNLIGQPFLLPVAWDLDTIRVRTSDGLIRPLGEARDAVSAYAWGFAQSTGDSNAGSYYPIADPATSPPSSHSLQPWEAYWVRAMKACELILPAPDNGLDQFPVQAAPAHYSVQDLGEIPDSLPLSACINDHGWAAFRLSDGAYLLRNGTITSLPVKDVYPTSIWESDVVATKPDGAAVHFSCEGGNLEGLWMGTAFGGPVPNSYGYFGSRTKDGAAVGGSPMTVLASGAGANCVYSGGGDCLVGQAGSRACKWWKGWPPTVDLGLQAPSCARDVSYSNTIVGYEGAPESGGPCRAFIWEKDTISYMTAPTGFPSSAAFSINNFNRAVGVMYNTGAHKDGHAFIWMDGVTHDLNDMIPHESGWELTWAQEINSLDQIIGEGRLNGKRHVVLLSRK